MKKIILSIALISASLYAKSQDITGVFYDPRDDQEYETVILEFELEGGVLTEREWMTSNLNYEMEGSYCYKNYPEYCETYGQLYTWKAAQKACPTGWHLSLESEWTMITKKYGGSQQAAAEMKEGGESGLAFIMSGFGEADGLFIDIGVNGYYWNAKNSDRAVPGLITFHTGEDYFSDDDINTTHRNSIRCVKDREDL